MKAESRLWRWLKPRMGSIACRRLECRMPEGIPDILWISRRQTGFLELKAVASTSEVPTFRPAQLPFVRAFRRDGGLARILVGVDGPNGWSLYMDDPARPLMAIAARGWATYPITLGSLGDELTRNILCPEAGTP